MEGVLCMDHEEEEEREVEMEEDPCPEVILEMGHDTCSEVILQPEHDAKLETRSSKEDEPCLEGTSCIPRPVGSLSERVQGHMRKGCRDPSYLGGSYNVVLMDRNRSTSDWGNGILTWFHGIPTLEEVLDIVRDHERAGFRVLYRMKRAELEKRTSSEEEEEEERGGDRDIEEQGRTQKGTQIRTQDSSIQNHKQTQTHTQTHTQTQNHTQNHTQNQTQNQTQTQTQTQNASKTAPKTEIKRGSRIGIVKKESIPPSHSKGIGKRTPSPSRGGQVSRKSMKDGSILSWVRESGKGRKD